MPSLTVNMCATVLLLLLFARLSRAKNETTDSPAACDYSLQPLTENIEVNFTVFCKEKPCIVKCCAENEILFKNTTLESRLCANVDDLQRDFKVTNLYDYSGIEIYKFNENKDAVKTKKTFKDFTHWRFVNYERFITDCSQFISLPEYAKLYIMQDGSLRLRRFNFIDDWYMHYQPGQFCLDRFVFIEEDGVPSSAAPPVMLLGVLESPKNKAVSRVMLTAVGMVVSCVFLALVLVVYALLRDLRNLPGLLLMAHTATMFAYFLLRAVHVISNDHELLEKEDCIIMTLLVYYTMISSFSWMNVMSFDIWWTLRGMRKQRMIHRRGIMVKFLWYCAYAWGVPLAPTVFMVVVDNMDLTHLPDFIKPHIFEGYNCFFEQESFIFYLSLPLALMIGTNIVLFSMTAYNIWAVRRSVEAVGSASTKNKLNDRYVVYIKLFLVMGVNWIVEVVSSVVDSEVWYVSDVLNGLVGVFIFIMFVCKKHIVRDLCTLCSIDNAFVRRLGARGDFSTSTAKTRQGTRTESTVATADSHLAPETHFE